MKRLAIVVLCAFGCCVALAADDPGQAARQLGADGNARAGTASRSDPASFPGYQGTDVPQTQYYHSGTAIETQARTTASDSTGGSVVSGQALSGPRFYFQNSDPLLQNANRAQIASGSLLASHYQGCQTLTPAGSGSNASEARCYASALQVAPHCTRALQASCPPNASAEAGIQAGAIASDMKWDYTFPTLTLGTIADNDWSGHCAIFDRTTTFTVAQSEMLKAFRLTQVGYDDYLLIDVNGHVVFVGPHGGDRLEVVNGRVQTDGSGTTGACELNHSWQQSVDVDLRPYLVAGTNTIRMRVEVSGNGEGWMKIDAENYPDCSANDRWTTQCDMAPPASGCTLESQVCTQGPETRVINGVPQYRACWAYEETYHCGSPQQQEEAACATLRSRGCQQTASACTAHDASGRCTRYEQRFRCPATPGANADVTLCGSELYCPGGDCTSDVAVPAASNVTQMATASTWLQAAQNAATDNTNASGTFSFFAGAAMKCDKAALGYSNCCSDSGWGNDVGLAQCSNEEKQLGIARHAQRTHYVGKYDTGSLFTTEHQVYCSFSSLLSRLIQEQGRVQLGVTWGSARDPNCRALTPDEMSRLDLGAMDFSAFYAQAQADAAAGLSARESNEAIEQHLQRQLDAMTRSPGGTDGP